MYRFLISFLLLFCQHQHSFAQKTQELKLSQFEISIEHSANNTFTLLCKKGCNWTRLSFSDVNPYKVYHVNEFGMEKGNDEAHFGFTIQCHKEEIILNSYEGTAWTKLTFSCPNGKAAQSIDEFGMK